MVSARNLFDTRTSSDAGLEYVGLAHVYGSRRPAYAVPWLETDHQN
jgi:hypothetical protein